MTINKLLKKYLFMFLLGGIFWAGWVLVGINLEGETRLEVDKFIADSLGISNEGVAKIFKYDVKTYGPLHNPILKNIKLNLNKLVGRGGVAKMRSIEPKIKSLKNISIEILGLEVEGKLFNKVIIKKICGGDCLYYITISTDDGVSSFTAPERVISKIISSEEMSYEATFELLEDSGSGYQMIITRKSNIKFQSSDHEILKKININKLIINKVVGSDVSYKVGIGGDDVLAEIGVWMDGSQIRDLNLKIGWGGKTDMKSMYCGIKDFCENGMPNHKPLHHGLLGKIRTYLMLHGYSDDKIYKEVVSFISKPGKILINDDDDIGDFEPKRVIFRSEIVTEYE